MYPIHLKNPVKASDYEIDKKGRWCRVFKSANGYALFFMDVTVDTCQLVNVYQ